jgi:hypothetical protein
MDRLNILVCLFVSVLFLTTLSYGCKQQTPVIEQLPPVSDTTLTDSLPLGAEKVSLFQLTIKNRMRFPTPTILPTGYKIQDVYYDDRYTHGIIILLISDEEIEMQHISDFEGDEFQCKMIITIWWSSQGIPGGIKLPVERATIVPSRGRTVATAIFEGGDSKTLLWQWRPNLRKGRNGMFEITLSAPNDYPKEAMVKILESMQ